MRSNSSPVPDLLAVDKWKYFNVEVWKKYDDKEKDQFLNDLFNWKPEEPFYSIKHLRHLLKEYSDFNKLDEDDLNHMYHLLLKIIPVSYTCAPEIIGIHSIIKNAGDNKFSTKIEDFISENENKCKGKSGIDLLSPDLKNIPYSPKENELKFIDKLRENIKENGYSLPDPLPNIFISLATPPFFLSNPKLENIDSKSNPEIEIEIEIENLLGEYRFQEQQIIIYFRGIHWFCTKYKEVKPEWLSAVVLIHEIAHWITHQIYKPHIPNWSNELYRDTKTDVHEGLAQLMTYWIANDFNGEFNKTFATLNKKQSKTYKVYETFKHVEVKTILNSLEKLILLSKPATFGDWKEIINVLEFNPTL